MRIEKIELKASEQETLINNLLRDVKTLKDKEVVSS